MTTELLKGHLKYLESVATDSNLWPQISLNLWSQVQICSHRFESVATDSKYFYFSDVPLKPP